MILLLLGLVSLAAIYLTRLLMNRKMKAAAISVAALFSVIVFWMYFIFVFDAAKLGFNGTETWRSILIGSDVYRSFIDLTTSMSVLPTTMLHAITYVSTLILVLAAFVVIHGFYSTARIIIRYAKTVKIAKNRGERKSVQIIPETYKRIQFFRLNCRMNC